MNKSKIKALYIVLFFAMVAGAGCTKWLSDVDKDPSNLSPDSYYTLPGHADAAIASAYARTRFIGEGAGIFATNFSMLEMPTGTARTETGQNTDLNNLLGLSYNGENVFITNWWNGCYSVVAQTNLVLDKVPAIVMDEAKKKQVLGEARFLRAWAYFYLVRLYGDVPLLDSSIYIATDARVYAPRTTKDSIYIKIISDLKIAETAGLPNTDAGGRVSTGAVKSLLAEVYLNMAGQPLNKGQEYYTLAAQKSAEVVTANWYTLFPTYFALHDEAQENKGEHIFQLQFLAGVANNDMQTHMLPNLKNISAIGTEVGSTVPTTQFYNSYEAGDKRIQGFFYTAYFEGGNGALKSLGAPYIYKHFDSVCHGVAGKAGTASSGLNRMNIRFAQVLLTHAEAANEAAAAPPQSAYDALKAIRDRAGLTTPAIGTFSKATFREAVWRERWHELSYEGVTWFDMIRLKKAYNAGNNTFVDFVGYVNPISNAALAEKHLLFPLPLVEMQNNPNLRPQNPGYPGL